MSLKRLSNALMFIALGLAVTAALSLNQPDSRQQTSSSIQPVAVTVSMNEIMTHVKTPFEFTITNRGSRPLRVAGTPSICTHLACVWAVEPPAEIPPNRSVTFHYVCSAGDAGTIEAGTVIYLEGEAGVGLTVPVTFQGTALASPESATRPGPDQ